MTTWIKMVFTESRFHSWGSSSIANWMKRDTFLVHQLFQEYWDSGITCTSASLTLPATDTETRHSMRKGSGSAGYWASWCSIGLWWSALTSPTSGQTVWKECPGNTTLNNNNRKTNTELQWNRERLSLEKLSTYSILMAQSWIKEQPLRVLMTLTVSQVTILCFQMNKVVLF